MATDKYTECPLKAAGFKVEYFSELGTLVIGADGKCICTIDKRCMNVDKRDEQRCTVEQLRQLNREASYRRGYQSGGD